MVTHSVQPSMACSAASGSPETISQMIFTSSETGPPPYRTSFPKGKKLSDANLKHCIPMGIPTMVIHQRQPARHQLRPLSAPPKTNHNRFPRHPILRRLLPFLPEPALQYYLLPARALLSRRPQPDPLSCFRRLPSYLSQPQTYCLLQTAAQLRSVMQAPPELRLFSDSPQRYPISFPGYKRSYLPHLPC